MNDSFSVLLVEDDKLTQIVTKKILENFKLKVHIATSGEDAIKQFNAYKPSLILMDIGLPGSINGVQATQHIRQNTEELGKTIPIIAVTAHAREKDIQKFREAQMNDVIIKPILLEELKSIFERFLPAHADAISKNYVC